MARKLAQNTRPSFFVHVKRGSRHETSFHRLFAQSEKLRMEAGNKDNITNAYYYVKLFSKPKNEVWTPNNRLHKTYWKPSNSGIAAINLSISVVWVQCLTLQQGHTNSLMFSTIPMMFNFILRQKLISLQMVAMATFWGVVTRTAPSGLELISVFTTARCSSEVPGGVCVDEGQGKWVGGWRWATYVTP